MRLGLKKKLALEAYRLYRHNEIKAHPLTYFFWECTLRCNLHCQHCGSDCVADAIPDMPREDFLRVLDGLAPHIDPKNFAVVITGGEPLMRADLEQCAQEIKNRGYAWGMVTNGLGLTPERFTKLMNAGLRSLTISLDGLEENHNLFRGNPHSFERAVRAIHMAASVDDLTFDVMTCVNKKNLNELPRLHNLLVNLGQTFEFIREAKKQGQINVNYDCEGFLGSYEKVVRDNPFFCWAGVNIASVLCDGSISACPSLRGDYIQGNIYKDDLWDVWQNRYQVMRDRSWARIGECRDCKYWRYCEGSSLHLRDEKTKELAHCHIKRLEAAGV